jgi:hypothetical protein
MDTLVAVLAAIVVVLTGAKLVQRRRRDEIRSIHSYHDRLDTLHVEPHDRGGSVRLVRGQLSHDAPSAPGRPRLDPESAHVDSTPGALPAEPRSRHDRRWALERMQPRARVDTATILIVLTVIVVLVGIALAGYAIQHDRGATTSTTTTTTTRPTTSSRTTAVASLSRVASIDPAAPLAAVTVTQLIGGTSRLPSLSSTNE